MTNDVKSSSQYKDPEHPKLKPKSAPLSTSSFRLKIKRTIQHEPNNIDAHSRSNIMKRKYSKLTNTTNTQTIEYNDESRKQSRQRKRFRFGTKQMKKYCGGRDNDSGDGNKENSENLNQANASTRTTSTTYCASDEDDHSTQVVAVTFCPPHDNLTNHYNQQDIRRDPWMYDVGSFSDVKSYGRTNYSSLPSESFYNDQNYSCVSNKWSIADFTLGSILGRGKFGCVYKATEIHRNHPSMIRSEDNAKHDVSESPMLALKVLHKEKVLSCEVALELLKREVEIHCRLNHKNIIRMLGYFHNSESIFLVLQEAKKGEVWRNVMAKEDGNRLQEHIAVKYIYQVAQALLYLQTNHVSHRDIKPENLLLASNDQIQLCDFGWAIYYKNDAFRKTLCGTPEYVPPEMLATSRSKSSSSSKSLSSSILGMTRAANIHKKEISHYNTTFVDIWALGVLSYEMVNGRTMFYIKTGTNTGKGREKVFAKIRSFHEDLFDWTTTQREINERVSGASFAHFVKNLMRINPEKRMKMNDVLNHAWFHEHDLVTKKHDGKKTSS